MLKCTQFVSLCKSHSFLYFVMLVISCLVISSLLIGSELGKTTKVEGSGLSSYMQFMSGMQLMAEGASGVSCGEGMERQVGASG